MFWFYASKYGNDSKDDLYATYSSNLEHSVQYSASYSILVSFEILYSPTMNVWRSKSFAQTHLRQTPFRRKEVIDYNNEQFQYYWLNNFSSLSNLHWCFELKHGTHVICWYRSLTSQPLVWASLFDLSPCFSILVECLCGSFSASCYENWGIYYNLDIEQFCLKLHTESPQLEIHCVKASV